MATVFDPNKKEEKDKEGQGQQPATLGTQTQAMGTAGGAPTAAPQQKKASSGAFSNVQKFIRANRPSQFAGQVAGKIGGQVQGVQSGLAQSQDQFKRASEAGRVDTADVIAAGENIFAPKPQPKEVSENAGARVGNKINEANAQLNTMQMQSDGVNITNDQMLQKQPDQSNKPLSNATIIGQALGKGGYTGPQGLENQQVLSAKARQASNLGKGFGSFSGTAQALGRLYGRPDYSSGQRRLDATLLGQDRSGQLQQAASQAQQTATQVESASSMAQQRAADLTRANQEFVSGLKEKVLGEATDLSGAITTAQQEAQRQQDQLYNTIVEKLNKGLALSPSEVKALGISGNVYMDPSEIVRYINKSGQVSATQAMNPEQVARLQALQELMGSSGGAIDLDVVNQYSGAEDFGTAGPAFTTNLSSFQAENAKREATYNKNKQHYQDVANDVQSITEKLAADKKMLDYFQKVDPVLYRDTIKTLESKIKQRNTDLDIQSKELKKLESRYRGIWGKVWDSPLKFDPSGPIKR